MIQKKPNAMQVKVKPDGNRGKSITPLASKKTVQEVNVDIQKNSKITKYAMSTLNFLMTQPMSTRYHTVMNIAPIGHSPKTMGTSSAKSLAASSLEVYNSKVLKQIILLATGEGLVHYDQL